ncbi:hypothetical protein JOF36_005329 [Pseudonocardia parietis]|uniref:Uncharacterized protein n=1 Tax=Pseudonocardia parietis TaxID=570936 RepID=A0ABS4W0K9_9PSEU|nr:hypothetical protein [Pseudonocardia parietis]
MTLRCDVPRRRPCPTNTGNGRSPTGTRPIPGRGPGATERAVAGGR